MCGVSKSFHICYPLLIWWWSKVRVLIVSLRRNATLNGIECLQAWSSTSWWMFSELVIHCLLIWCRQEVSVQFIWWQVAPCINESTTCNHINLTNTHLKELHCNIDTQFVIYFLYRTMTGVKMCSSVLCTVLCGFCTIYEVIYPVSNFIGNKCWCWNLIQ